MMEDDDDYLLDEDMTGGDEHDLALLGARMAHGDAEDSGGGQYKPVTDAADDGGRQCMIFRLCPCMPRMCRIKRC